MPDDLRSDVRITYSCTYLGLAYASSCEARGQIIQWIYNLQRNVWLVKRLARLGCPNGQDVLWMDIETSRNNAGQFVA